MKAIRIAASIAMMLSGLVSGAFALLYLFSSTGFLFGAACAVLAGALMYGGNWLLATVAASTPAARD
jgi:amino acid permease